MLAASCRWREGHATLALDGLQIRMGMKEIATLGLGGADCTVFFDVVLMISKDHYGPLLLLATQTAIVSTVDFPVPLVPTEFRLR